MPYSSRWTVDIPDITLPTFLFGSASAPLPDKPVFIDVLDADRYVLKFADYRLWAQRFALGLKRLGLRPGESVLVYSGNSLFFPVCLVGTIMAEGKFTGANPGYNAREVAYQLKNSEARFLILNQSSFETGWEAAQQAGIPKDRIFIFDGGVPTFDGHGKDLHGCKHWTKMLASPEDAARFQWREDKSMIHNTIALNYSSGTTGLPKGVELTHRNYVANALQQLYLPTLRPDFKEKVADYRWLCFLPMYHALAQTLFCVSGPSKRITTYLMQKYDFRDMLQAIQQCRITELQLVPPIAITMAKSPLTKEYDLSSVKHVGCGAAPLGAEPQREFERLWPEGVVNMKQGWGMTEVTCSALGWDPNKHSDSYGVGEPNPNVEIKLVDPDSFQEKNDGERGEIWVRGPNVMKGYWKNDKATKETLVDDGWLRTGDIGQIDRHGCVFIVDRIKELIKVKGAQVAPAELETLLLGHPAINDAAVVGVTVKGQEHPRAYVVLAAGQKVAPEEVAKFMETKVSKIKHLTGGVKIVDSIVKNPSGKILRKILREQAEKEVGDSLPKSSRL